MLNSPLFAILAGTVLGFLSGLGTGGGSLLILYLTMVLDMDPQIARQVNLMFFVPAALVACLLRCRHGRLNMRQFLPAAITGCAAAAAASVLEASLDLAILKKLFGLLLLATGVRELLYRPRKAR